MNDLVITHTDVPVAPSLIGFNVGGQTLSVRDTLKHMAANITIPGLWKVGCATAIAGAATSIKAAHVALSEIEDSRSQLQARVETLQRRNSEMASALSEAQAKTRKPTRWTQAERAALAEELVAHPGPRPGYRAIAGRMSERFNRTFSADAVGAQARKLRAAPSEPASTTKAPSKPRSRRRAAV
jgi:hypothetical protein